jgi:nitrite reductase (NADH) large subunit
MPTSARERLVVIGNGMAGVRTIELLLARAPSRYDITVFGAERYPNYNRILLSSVLAGETTADDIVTHPRSWYAQHRIRLIDCDPVVAIDRRAKTVRSAGDIVMLYDKLLLATGSKPLAPPIPGLDLPGVCAFRDVMDAEEMIAAARTGRTAVVIGGGLLGLEAAWGLKRRGMDVTVVHLMPTLMERQLDGAAARLLQRDLEMRGIRFVTNGDTEKILGHERAKGIRLTDGREFPAELVVLAIGIRPNIDLARAAGLDLNRGVLVGDDLRTSDPAVYAVGECVEHNGQVYGLLSPLWEQASVCAARLAGDAKAAFAPPPVFTSLKITGIDVFSAGALAAADPADEEIILHDASGGTYKKLVLRGDRLVGAVLYGAVADGPWYVDLIREGTDVAVSRDRLAFGRAYVPPEIPWRAAA